MTFRRLWRHARSRLREPVIVDRRIDICAAITWLLLGMWGTFASISKYTTVASVTGPDYNLLWGLSIGVLGLIAAAATLSTLHVSNAKRRATKKTVELITVSLITGLISVLPLLKIVEVFEKGFSTDSIAAAAVSSVFIVFPTWRIFHLTERIRNLRKMDNV